jgi:hypothetical protein
MYLTVSDKLATYAGRNYYIGCAERDSLIAWPAVQLNGK